MAIPGSGWINVPGWASDVGVGRNGDAYHIGGGGAIYRWDGGNGWHNISGGGSAISVGPDGHPWVVGGNLNVYRWNGTGWEDLGAPLGGVADIGVGADGSAWSCFYNPRLIHRGIYQWNEHARTWVKQGGYASSIAVAGDGTPWHVGDDGKIFRWQNNNWIQEGGIAYDIGVGPNGEVWHIGDNDRIYYFDNGNWVQVEGDAKRIAVGPNGLPWICNSVGAIFRRV